MWLSEVFRAKNITKVDLHGCQPLYLMCIIGQIKGSTSCYCMVFQRGHIFAFTNK
jgi:hypothetical protein